MPQVNIVIVDVAMMLKVIMWWILVAAAVAFVAAVVDKAADTDDDGDEDAVDVPVMVANEVFVVVVAAVGVAENDVAWAMAMLANLQLLRDCTMHQPKNYWALVLPMQTKMTVKRHYYCQLVLNFPVVVVVVAAYLNLPLLFLLLLHLVKSDAAMLVFFVNTTPVLGAFD